MEINIIDSLARFCLKFGHITFILPIVMICMIFHKRDIYAKAACFLLWVMIFNTLLKQLFKVPLFPNLGSGYAFPSGHMHAASIFYGYILYKTDNKIIKLLLAILLSCLGVSLIYCNFHDWFDVLGAVGFAVTEILIYHVISINFGDRIVGIISIISAISIMLILNAIYKVEFHVWLAFYGLIGMEFSLFIIEEKKLNQLSKKFLALILSTLMITAVYYLFRYLAFDKYYLSEIRFALIPLIIIGFTNFAARVRI